MSAFTDPWEALGIAPTHDPREVRRAYSKLLKAIDVEAEPERFVALREAFEHATALANMAEIPPALEPVAALTPSLDDRWSGAEEADPGSARSTVPPHDVQAPDPVPHEPEDPINLHAAALERLLLSHPDDWMPASPEETEAMLDHWAVISADPRLEELGFYAQAEAWAAEVVAQGCPFSDPLVPIVIEKFGWIASAGQLGQSPAVRYILARHATLGFLREIEQKSHPLHRAWKELTTVATEKSRRGWGTRRKSVLALLKLIREEHPDAERYLDSWRVGLWENAQPSVVPWQAMAFGLFILIQAARMFSAGTHDTRPTAPVNLVADALTDQARDIDRVVKLVSRDHLDGKQVQEGNSAWYGDIAILWNNQKLNGGNIWDLQAELSEMVSARFTRVVGKAPYDQIKSYQKLVLQSGLYYKNIGSIECKDFFTNAGKPPPEELRTPLRNAVYDILLHTGEDVAKKTGASTFSVPGDVMEMGAKKARLSRDDFGMALNKRGSAQQQCDARIALLQVAIALPPKRGLKLLRAM